MIRMHPVLFARMLTMMRDDPCTVSDIVEETGLHPTTVREYCRELHKHRIISVASWIILPLSKTRVPVYQLGDQRDAKKPPPLPASVRQMNCRRRKQARDLQAAMNQLVRASA